MYEAIQNEADFPFQPLTGSRILCDSNTYKPAWGNRNVSTPGGRPLPLRLVGLGNQEPLGRLKNKNK